mmetsp:Transcript_4687/g.11223  ORF Transcript_4687/g.11223 Transcript_4687/m.11223 type:complete len:241 (-) Transcript_4687:166-888(-)
MDDVESTAGRPNNALIPILRPLGIRAVVEKTLRVVSKGQTGTGGHCFEPIGVVGIEEAGITPIVRGDGAIIGLAEDIVQNLGGGTEDHDAGIELVGRENVGRRSEQSLSLVILQANIQKVRDILHHQTIGIDVQKRRILLERQDGQLGEAAVLVPRRDVAGPFALVRILALVGVALGVISVIHGFRLGHRDEIDLDNAAAQDRVERIPHLLADGGRDRHDNLGRIIVATASSPGSPIGRR